MTDPETPAGPRIIGRYALCTQIAAGGMAAVHLGRLLGQAGFSRSVAIKRLHPHLAEDPEFVSMLLDEARLVARIRHPNVVATLDVVALDGELLLVMEYVHGESLSRLLTRLRRQNARVPPPVAAAIVSGVLYGLHAAHEATNESGQPLSVIHRDISPQNVMVGSDGVSRVVDFGVAKAAGRLQETREGQLKGKIRYMAPEQLKRGAIDRHADVYAASVVLWETLTSQRLFDDENEWRIAHAIVEGATTLPSQLAPEVPAALDRVVMRGLSVNPADRYPTALEMAEAIEEAISPATPRQVANWLMSVARETLEERARQLSAVEEQSKSLMGPLAKEAPSSPSHPRQQEPPSSDRISSSETNESSNTAAGTYASLRAPSAASQTKRRVTPMATALLTAAGVFGLGLALYFVIHALGHAHAAPSAAASRVATQNPPEPPATRVEANPAPEVSAPASAPAEPAAPEALASALPKPKARVVATASKPSGASPSKSSSQCSPPFFFDKDGVKRFKPECL